MEGIVILLIVGGVIWLALHLLKGASSSRAAHASNDAEFRPLARGDVLSGRVTVIDGDGIVTKLDGYKVSIRLHGIDAPETDQPGGRQARRHLERLIGRDDVTVTLMDGPDRYGRWIGHVQNQAVDVNARMVADGHAWAYEQYGGRKYRHLQRLAERAGLGLWRDRDPIPPWEFRRAQRGGGGYRPRRSSSGGKMLLRALGVPTTPRGWIRLAMRGGRRRRRW